MKSDHHPGVQLPVQRALEFGQDLPVLFAVNVDKRPVGILKPKRTNYSVTADRTQCCALGAVERSFLDDIWWLGGPEAEMLAVHLTVEMKMCFVSEPNLVREVLVRVSPP